jgi:xylulokinase
MLRPRHGWVEQSPHAWWSATTQALRELLSVLPALEVIGVGLSGQVNGLVLLDGRGQLLGDAIIWLDTRATEEARRIQLAIGPLLAERTAGSVSAISVLAKLSWLATHEPDRLRATARVLFVKDYIAWRLTDQVGTDPSEATSAGMMDIETHDWLAEAVEAAGIHPRLLPSIRPSIYPAGAVTPQAAAECGLPPGVRVVTGAGDVAALAMGCGVLRSGAVGVTLGTAGHVVVSAPTAVPFPIDSGLWRIAHVEPTHAIWLGLVMSGGMSLSWFHRTVQSAGSAIDLPTFAALAEKSTTGSGGVSFAPFLEGAATPYGSPQARGMFTGLSSSSGLPDMVRAVMEGVAFNVRQCLELYERAGVEIADVRVAEGGARIDLWCQILADSIGRPLTRLKALNTSCTGAALLALARSASDLERLAEASAEAGRVFSPDDRRSAEVELSYERYLAVARYASDSSSKR